MPGLRCTQSTTSKAYSLDGDIYANNAEVVLLVHAQNRFLFSTNCRERSENHRLTRERHIKGDSPASFG
jgi:hypothetical protein